MREIILDCAEMTHISQFHSAIAPELGFADACGRNYDALHDRRTALTEPTHLILRGLDRAMFPTGILRRVLWDSQEENPLLTVTL